MREFARKVLIGMNIHENSWVATTRDGNIGGHYTISEEEGLAKAFPEENGDLFLARLLIGHGNDLLTWGEMEHGLQVVKFNGSYTVVDCEPGEAAYLKRHHLDGGSNQAT